MRHPNRLVSHTCSNTEILCALGLSHLIVGVDSDSDYPVDALAGVPRLGRDLNLDIAAVAALKPGLVLTSATLPGHAAIVDALHQQGLATLVCGPQSLADVYDDIHRIARTLGVPERGEALTAEMRAAMPPVHRASRRPRVLVEWWPKPVIAAARHSWVHDLIELAGGTNALEDISQQSVTITHELIAVAKPDVVVMSWCGVPARNYRAEIVSSREPWQGVPALRDGQVHGVTEAYLGRPGPRLVQGFQALRAIIAAA